MRAILFSTLLAPVFLVLGFSMPASADDIATFPGGKSSHVARDSATRATFPLDLPRSVRAEGITVRPIAVRQNDIPAKDLFDAVTVIYRMRVPAIVIVLNDKSPEAGQYDITAQLAYGKRRQFVTFTFARDSADLKAPSSVELEQTQGWSFGREDLVAESPFLLRVGPHDRLAEGRLQLAETDSTKGSVCEDLESTDSGDFELKLEPKGVPLGESTHTCEVTSPELAAPVAIDVSVTSQRSVVWIALLVVLGVLAGYGVREFIAPRLISVRAQLALARVRLRIAEKLESASGNEPLTRALSAALNIANSVSDDDPVDVILKATKDAWAAYLAAIAQPGITTQRLDRYRQATTNAARQAVSTLKMSSFLLGVARFVLLTFVLVLTSYALFEDTWVGTWQQMAAVVSWAFAIDVTTSAVQQELGKSNPQQV